MRILFAGHKERGVACLRALLTHGHTVVAVLAHPPSGPNAPRNAVAQVTSELGLPLLQPADVNGANVLVSLREFEPGVMVTAGYAPILQPALIGLAPRGCLNLHAGKLPEYRGSSPMNWALINGEKEFTLSILQVDSGVDTGDLLAERTFPISLTDTIADLTETANRIFPEMLREVLEAIQRGTLRPRKQDPAKAVYHPLRFQEDGLILWDRYTAEQVHNRIRALTDPYPGAFTFCRGRQVKLLKSRPAKQICRGEAGRIYLKNENGLLVCASDKCLWVCQAQWAETQSDCLRDLERYEKFATLADLAVAGLLPPPGSDLRPACA